MNGRAIKAGLAEAARMSASDRLAGGDERFRRAWGTAASVPGSFDELNAAAMFVLLEELRPRRIVEIGSFLGRSTSFFALLAKELAPPLAEVVAVDPHTGDRQQMEALGAETLPTFALFQAHVEAVGATDVVRPIVARSADAAQGWSDPIDFLYVDGWHSYDAVIEDGEAWLPHLTDRGVVFFDDYSRYDEVRRAVDDLAARGAFRLWGNSFGQAVGGRGEPGPAGRRLIDVAHARVARRLFRPRG